MVLWENILIHDLQTRVLKGEEKKAISFMGAADLQYEMEEQIAFTIVYSLIVSC